jgi:hypothetical protein
VASAIWIAPLFEYITAAVDWRSQDIALSSSTPFQIQHSVVPSADKVVHIGNIIKTLCYGAFSRNFHQKFHLFHSRIRENFGKSNWINR